MVISSNARARAHTHIYTHAHTYGQRRHLVVHSRPFYSSGSRKPLQVIRTCRWGSAYQRFRPICLCISLCISRTRLVWNALKFFKLRTSGIRFEFFSSTWRINRVKVFAITLTGIACANWREERNKKKINNEKLIYCIKYNFSSPIH